MGGGRGEVEAPALRTVHLRVRPGGPAEKRLGRQSAAPAWSTAYNLDFAT